MNWTLPVEVNRLLLPNLYNLHNLLNLSSPNFHGSFWSNPRNFPPMPFTSMSNRPTNLLTHLLPQQLFLLVNSTIIYPKSLIHLHRNSEAIVDCSPNPRFSHPSINYLLQNPWRRGQNPQRRPRLRWPFLRLRFSIYHHRHVQSSNNKRQFRRRNGLG